MNQKKEKRKLEKVREKDRIQLSKFFIMQKAYIFIVTLTTLILVSCTQDIRSEKIVNVESDIPTVTSKPKEAWIETSSWVIESATIYSDNVYTIRKIVTSYSGGLKDIVYEIDIASYKIKVGSVNPPYNIEITGDRLYYSFDFPDGVIHTVFDLKTWKKLASFGWVLSEDKNYIIQCYASWYDVGTVKLYDRKLLLSYSIVDFGEFLPENKKIEVLDCKIEKGANWQHIRFTTSDSSDVYTFSLSTKELINTSKNTKIKIDGTGINNAQ